MPDALKKNNNNKTNELGRNSVANLTVSPTQV
jgi:hypothetical protein